MKPKKVASSGPTCASTSSFSTSLSNGRRRQGSSKRLLVGCLVVKLRRSGNSSLMTTGSLTFTTTDASTCLSLFRLNTPRRPMAWDYQPTCARSCMSTAVSWALSTRRICISSCWTQQGKRTSWHSLTASRTLLLRYWMLVERQRRLGTWTSTRIFLPLSMDQKIPWMPTFSSVRVAATWHSGTRQRLKNASLLRSRKMKTTLRLVCS